LGGDAYMASHTVSTLTVAEALEILELKPTDLVRMTGLGINAVRRAVLGGKKRTNIRTAKLIADALGLKIEELIWPAGLTDKGRPPLTGGTYTVGASAPKFKLSAGTDDKPSELRGDEDIPVRVKKRHFEEKYCTEHHLLLPLSGVCGQCAA